MPQYKLCPRCMLNYISEDEDYCEVCKEELRGVRFEEEEDDLYTKTCPRCGALIPDDADYCENCRQDLDDKLDDEDESWDSEESSEDTDDLNADAEESLDDDLPEGEGFEGDWSFPLDFTDAGRVSDWALEPMSWCVMDGVVTGVGNGRLAPQGTADRAQIVTMLYRFFEQ